MDQATTVKDAFNFGIALFGHVELEFTGKTIPEFPEGVPEGAFDAVDELLPALVSEDLF